MDPTPVSLLVRLRCPTDQAAWKRFVDLYTPLLYFWACRVGLKGQDASDLVQEVFLLLVQKLPAFEPDPARSFRAWLHTVAVNRYRDFLRSRQPAPAQVGREALENVPVPPAGDELWEKEYRKHVVGRAVQIMQADFAPATWKAFWALTVDGKPAEAVAGENGLTVAAVYAAKARVLRRLRQELAGMLD